MADGDVQHIDQAPDLPHHLGRSVVNHDPRNRDYPIRALLKATSDRRYRSWYARHNFDQRGSSCTTQAATGGLLSAPHRFNRTMLAWVKKNLGTEAQRHAFYLRSQAYDPWPGGEPTYEGSSSDAPYKVLREMGVISEWRWCFGTADIDDTLLQRSPVTVGTIWHDSMFQVDRKGYLVVDRNSPVVGGHEWLLLRRDVDDDEYGALNSWGRPWGVNGRMKVRGNDLRYLMEMQGDATVVVL